MRPVHSARTAAAGAELLRPTAGSAVAEGTSTGWADGFEMTYRPDLSVLMCTYNGERYVEEQVSSILAQTLLPAVLIVADDGSTDATLERIQVLLRNSPAPVELQILPQADHRLGVVENVSRAIRAARTDVIALADQDDVWLPTRLASAMEQLDHDPRAVLVGSNVALIDAVGAPLGLSSFQALELTDQELGLLRSGRALPVLLRRNAFPGMSMTMRRDFASAALPIPPGWFHDYWLAAVAALSGGVRTIDESLVLYRQHGSNLIGIGVGGGMLAAAKSVKYMLTRPAGWTSVRARAWEALLQLIEPRGDLAADAGRLLEEKVDFEVARDPVGRRARGRLRLIQQARSGQYKRFAPRGDRELFDDLLAR